MRRSFIALMGIMLCDAPLCAQENAVPAAQGPAGAVPSASSSGDNGKEQEAPARVSVGGVLQGLDKVTARISEFEAPAGVMVPFGSLRITVRDCHKRPPEETPESAAFVVIDDIGADDRAVRYFSGWMFASSPALSALEHPVYDVWVVDCMKSSSTSSGSSDTNSADTSKAEESN